MDEEKQRRLKSLLEDLLEGAARLHANGGKLAEEFRDALYLGGDEAALSYALYLEEGAGAFGKIADQIQGLVEDMPPCTGRPAAERGMR